MFFDDYKGKQVVVTGAASGMGFAVAELLLELGADVIGIDAREITDQRMQSQLVNLLEESSIEAFVSSLQDKSTYALFCCAGLPQTFPADQVIAVNFLGNRRLMEGMLPKLEQQSAIAVITSLTLGWVQNAASLGPLVNSASMEEGQRWVDENLGSIGDSYVFAKEAMSAWATINSTRWIQRGIRVNCLCPGITKTPMLPAFYEAAGEQLEQLPKPLERDITPEEQAFAMVYLNHPRSSALVGHSLYNDGGSAAAIMSAVASGMVGGA